METEKREEKLPGLSTWVLNCSGLSGNAISWQPVASKFSIKIMYNKQIFANHNQSLFSFHAEP
jgi:hypothetical protein